MTMELWVFSDRQLHSMVEWQAAIDAEGFPLKLSKDTVFEKLSGFVPAHLRGALTGFECYHDDAEKLMRDNPDLDFGRHWKHVLAFRWLGSKEAETLAAWMAATAYARATNSVIFNDQDGRFRSASQSSDVIHNIEHPSSAYEEVRRASRQRRGLSS